MNTEDIKKALAVCAEDDCEGCRYYEFHNCYDKLKLDARDLIIKREQKIKQLKTECTLLDDELRNARQETINVLNKLKSKCHNYYPSIDHYCCSVKAVNLSDIDELIKELITNDATRND